VAKKKPGLASVSRINTILPTDLVARIDEARAALRRQGFVVSYSAMIEVALEELLGSRDLAALLRQRGAKGRRG
jgi:hypothetical protein